MGIVGWIKQNVIGDFAEARREYEAKERAKNPPLESMAVKTRSFNTRDFSLGIVGESHYQKTLTNAKRNVKNHKGVAYINAVLSLEPENQYDRNAIVVTTEQLETIGYLSRDDAKLYREAFELWVSTGRAIRCQAKLVGGEGRKKNIGAWLDIDTPEAIVTKYHDPKTRK